MDTKAETIREMHYENILKKVEQEMKAAYPAIHFIWHFGAMQYHPQYLVEVIAFQSDVELQRARSLGECDRIQAYWKDTMVKHGWPVNAFQEEIDGLRTQCDFASQETCNREFAGNWWYYYK